MPRRCAESASLLAQTTATFVSEDSIGGRGVLGDADSVGYVTERVSFRRADFLSTLSPLPGLAPSRDDSAALSDGGGDLEIGPGGGVRPPAAQVRH